MPTVQEKQESLVKILFNEIWNQKQVEKASELFQRDCLIHAGEKTIKGIENLKAILSHWQSAFPDITHEYDQLISSEGYITVRWHGWGTHLGIFNGLKPTRKKMNYSGVTIFKIHNGKFSEVWISADRHSIFTALKTFSDKVYTEKDFCENFQGPAGKIYEWILKARPIPGFKQKGANALRDIFSTVPIDGKPEIVIPPEIMEKVTVEEHFAPSRDGKVRSLVYLPEDYKKKSYPILVYLHGGGWSVGAPEDLDPLTRKIAYTSKVIVVSVDYRLAPEYPYPHGLTDSVDTYLWARKEGKKLFNANIDRVAIGGDSAGGNLAPAVVIRTRNENLRIPDACLMLCPLTDFMYEQYPSAREYGYNGLLYDFSFVSFVRAIYAKYEEWKLPEVSPMYDSLKDFCPTYLLIAGKDLLYDENLIFVKKLKEAGAVVEHFVHEEMPHAYYYFLGLTKEEDEASQNIAGFLRKFLS